MIRLITGVTRLNGRVLRPENGAFEAGKETEAYLVKRGVAVYVDGTAPTEPAPAEPGVEAPVIEPEAPTADAPKVAADTPKKPAPKKGAAKKS